MDLDDIEAVKRELQSKNEEIQRLKNIIYEKEHLEILADSGQGDPNETQGNKRNGLSNEEIGRYSRQLILPEIGVKGQLQLRQSSVLIVGAGGLGCPAAIYLAAAGIGTLGVVDYDEVELSNLHRQVLHTEDRNEFLRDLHSTQISLGQFQCYGYCKEDVVLDASDNVATRYLLNDVCVLARKPLVSGSALRFEGQLTVYNYKNGPCYRCLYPKPPPPETVTNCSDGGVLGVVPGIIGCLQALEAIKLLTAAGTNYSQRLLLFDALEGSFRTIKLRSRQLKCPVCGDNPTITELIDYEQFCGAKATDKDQSTKLLPEQDRILPKAYREMITNKSPHVLVDVRTEVEMEICQLPHPAINIPISKISKNDSVEKLKSEISKYPSRVPVVVVCRRGNDSQVAVQSLRDTLSDCDIELKDIRGGLHAWARQIDSNFPVY